MSNTTTKRQSSYMDKNEEIKDDKELIDLE